MIEVARLFNCAEAIPATWLNTQGFANVQAHGYWSSTTYPHTTDDAWIVGMREGGVYAGGKSGAGNYVWPVRAGQIQPADCSIWSDVIARYQAYVNATESFCILQ